MSFVNIRAKEGRYTVDHSLRDQPKFEDLVVQR